MSPARLLAVLLFSTLLACSGGGGPVEPEPQGPELPALSLGESTVGAPFSRSLASSTGVAPLSYSALGLPSGIALNSQTGALSGAATLAGTFDIQATVADASGRSHQRRYPLVVHPAPRFVTTTLPPATTAVTYVTRIEATGGKAPLVYAFGSGAFPPGLSIDASGTLSGTPTAPGSSSFELAVTDAHGAVARVSFTLEVRHPAPTLLTRELPQAYASRAYRFTFAASGGTPPYSWSKPAGELPAGLGLTSTGELTGTPSSAGTFSFTAEVRDSQGQAAQQALSLVVIPALVITHTTLPEGYRGAAYSAGLESSGGVPPYSYSVVTGSLPGGIQFDNAGRFSGTPSVSGAFNLTLTVQDASQQSLTRAFALTVYEPPGFASTTLRDGFVGSAYSETLQATGGKAPFTFRLLAGALPAGLQLSGNAITGTPTTPGTASFTLEVRDANNQTGTQAFTLRVPNTVAITTTTLPEGDTGQPYSAQLTATGGQGALSWSFTGTLPAGLSLSSSGLLSGTPTTAGSFSFTARVTDAGSRTDSRALTLVIQGPPVITTSALEDGYVTSPYSATLAASGGRAPFSWSVTGSLPPGMTLSSSGVLSGTPTSAGTASFDIQVRDANGRTGTQSLALAVYTLPTLTTSLLPEAVLGQPYSQTLTASGGKPGYAFFLEEGTLPEGLTLASDGHLAGTPAGSTSATFTIRAFDANGRSDARALLLFVYAPPRIITSSLPDATLDTFYSAYFEFSGNRDPFLWDYSGMLPPGLSFDTQGSISGTPVAAGTWSFTLILQDRSGATDSRTVTLVVRNPPPDGGSPDGGPDGGSPDGGDADGGTPPGSLFTVGHWNIEWFGSDTQGPPRSTSPGGTLDDLQINNARDVLGGTGVNLWGLGEMVDTQDFQALKAQLPGYDGFLSNDPRVTFGSSYYSPSEQKVGVLYDSSLIYQGATLILLGSDTDFAGRPPLRVDFVTSIRGVSTPLTVIVLHMKAFSDRASYDRRQRAGVALKNYLDSNLSTQHVLVLGDWNDDVDVSITYDSNGIALPSPYENFISDSARYTFVTRPLSLAGESSTVDYPDMIDHTLATNEVMVDYVANSASVLRPAWISDFDGTTSDHYPVLSRYDFTVRPSHRVFINEYLPNEPNSTLPDGGIGAGLVDHEFVELVNAGPQAADLSGWALWDGNTTAGPRHVFSAGTVLQPGKAWVVYGGPTAFPPGTPNTEAASSGRLGLNNTGTDYVTLRDSNGALVNEATYSSTVDTVSYNRAMDANPDTGFVPHTDLSWQPSSAGHRVDASPF